MNSKQKSWPSVSILIPTLNAGRVLDQCLTAINQQDYPQSKREIIIADGGSTDKTLEIAKKHKARLYSNPLKTAESGKAVALKKAKNDLIALIDSDNILPDKDWLKRMVAPFEDKAVLASEPWAFTFRPQDSLVDRYSALIGANDPYCYFIGNYDKKSVLSGKWTGLKLKEEDQGDYLKVALRGSFLPTVGANGTLWRKNVLTKAVKEKDYLFDTDIAYLVAPFYLAKVKTGIIHLYCPTVKDFYRKQKRRARDFFFLEGKKRQGTFQRQRKGQLYFILSTSFILPLFFQSIKGYLRKPDKAWFFHPLACLITLWLYATETILAWFRPVEMSREGWRQ